MEIQYFEFLKHLIRFNRHVYLGFFGILCYATINANSPCYQRHAIVGQLPGLQLPGSKNQLLDIADNL